VALVPAELSGLMALVPAEFAFVEYLGSQLCWGCLENEERFLNSDDRFINVSHMKFITKVGVSFADHMNEDMSEVIVAK